MGRHARLAPVRLIAWNGLRRIGSIGWEGSAATFAYAEEWLAAADAFPLSVTLPLDETVHAGPAVANWFGNLLPEGTAREAVERALRVRPDDDAALLGAIGGDCAGAIALLWERVEPREMVPGRRAITSSDFAELRGMRPMAFYARDASIRLSLAGAQDKIPVVWEEGRAWLPTNGAASSHVVKWEPERFKGLVRNEVLTMRLARELGIDCCEARLENLGDEEACVVRRFDRVTLPGGDVARVHQEDFCQATGTAAAAKYQADGGPSLSDCARVLSRHSLVPVEDVRRLVQWQAFNVVAGNADGHAKNLALLWQGSGFRLAPFYDLVCTRAWKHLDHHLAMPIGTCRDGAQVGVRCWQQLADDVAIGRRLVLDLVATLAADVPRALDQLAPFMDQAPERAVVATARKLAARASALLRSVD